MAKPLVFKNANASTLSDELAQTKKAKELIEAKIKSLQDSISALTKTEEDAVKNRKATLLFSEEAWLTMIMLVRDNSLEIAWHGVSYRLDDPERPDTYYVEKLLVYPQKVTGATVDFDQEKYEDWLQDLDDDTFNNLRSQFHSHVNMGTFPSATDTQTYKDILGCIPDDSYYIFGIWNKKDAHWLQIVDFRENVIFENTDITVKYEYDEGSIIGTVIAARDAVETKKYNYNANAGSRYTGYGSNNAPAQNTTTPQSGKPSDAPLDKANGGAASTGGGKIIPIGQGDYTDRDTDDKKSKKKGKKGKGKHIKDQLDDDYKWPYGDDEMPREYADAYYGAGYTK